MKLLRSRTRMKLEFSTLWLYWFMSCLFKPKSTFYPSVNFFRRKIKKIESSPELSRRRRWRKGRRREGRTSLRRHRDITLSDSKVHETMATLASTFKSARWKVQKRSRDEIVVSVITQSVIGPIEVDIFQPTQSFAELRNFNYKFFTRFAAKIVLGVRSVDFRVIRFIISTFFPSLEPSALGLMKH